MMRHIGFHRFASGGNPSYCLEMLVQVFEECVVPASVQLIEPPERQRVPSDVQGSFMNTGKLRHIFRAKHRSGILPDGPVFDFRVDGYSASVGQSLPVLPEMGLCELGTADGEDVEKPARRQIPAPSVVFLQRLQPVRVVGPGMCSDDGQGVFFDSIFHTSGEAVVVPAAFRIAVVVGNLHLLVPL